MAARRLQHGHAAAQVVEVPVLLATRRHHLQQHGHRAPVEVEGVLLADRLHTEAATTLAAAMAAALVQEGAAAAAAVVCLLCCL